MNTRRSAAALRYIGKLLTAEPASLQQAIDYLVVAGVLPATFASWESRPTIAQVAETIVDCSTRRPPPYAANRARYSVRVTRMASPTRLTSPASTPSKVVDVPRGLSGTRSIYRRPSRPSCRSSEWIGTGAP